VLDCSADGCCSTILTCEVACSFKLFSSLSEETLPDASNFAKRWTVEGGEKTGEGKERVGRGREDSSESSGELLENMSPSLSPF